MNNSKRTPFTVLFNTVQDVLTNAIKQGKEIKKIYSLKKEIKLSLLASDMIFSVGNLRELKNNSNNNKKQNTKTCSTTKQL